MDKDYVGMTVEDAVLAAKENGDQIRVSKKDGKSLMGTCDYRTERINVEVVDGKIVAIIGRG